MIPLIAVCVLLVVMMMLGVTAATSAFIAQRDIQADCDGAAAAAASEVDPDRPEIEGAKGERMLLPDRSAAQTAVDEYRRSFYTEDPTLTMRAAVVDGLLSVRCHRRVKIKFGTFFGKGDGVDRDAVSEIVSPVRPSSEASIVDN
ncbi:MAG: hypothetical protein ACRDTD_32100 [Pseudonocardiaceae bacterium]